MFRAVEKMIAFRYLRAKRSEGFVSVIAAFSFLGIVLGVATLIIVMSVMNGFRQELLDQILGLNGHVSIASKVAPGIPDFDRTAKMIQTRPGIIQVVPIIERQVMANNNGIAGGAMIHGMRRVDLENKKKVSKNIREGSLANVFEKSGIAIGKRMADKLRLKIGDTLTLISPQGNATAFGTMPRMRGYDVEAIFEVGMSEYDSLIVFMPLEEAQNFFRLNDAVSQFEIFTKNPDHLKAITDGLEKDLGSVYKIHDWQKANASFLGALEVERNVMFLILTLIILVAAFNIISSMIMLVQEKTASIAIMRTMGASQKSIMKIFFLVGSSVGVVGAAMGSILGVVFCWNIESIRQWLQTMTGRDLFSAEIYFLSKLPAVLDYREVIWVVVMALFLSFCATLYPSFKAARLDPVDALRGA